MGRRGRKHSRAEAHRRELPPDIIFSQILLRLQVKSLLRFKCVSKEWHSFLTTPAFAKMQFQHHADVLSPKLVALSTTKRYKFFTMDCEKPEQGFSAGRPLPFKVKVGPWEFIRILTSVHGLVCIGIWPHNYHQYSDLILWNPATGDHKTLSKPLAISHQEDCYHRLSDHNTNETLFGLCHSSWDDDYKLLHLTRYLNVYVYSLKSDSWRKVESDMQPTRRVWGQSVSLSENMYFLGSVHNDPYSIMRFNTKTETLKVIATPLFGDGRTTWLSFTVDKKRDGCIDLWVNIQNPVNLSTSENELWRMEGDGDWTKVESYSTIFGGPYIQYELRLHLMRSGQLLLLCAGCVYQIDFMKTNVTNVCSYTQMHVWPGEKLIETMVSPNQYVK